MFVRDPDGEGAQGIAKPAGGVAAMSRLFENSDMSKTLRDCLGWGLRDGDEAGRSTLKTKGRKRRERRA